MAWNKVKPVRHNAAIAVVIAAAYLSAGTSSGENVKAFNGSTEQWHTVPVAQLCAYGADCMQFVVDKPVSGTAESEQQENEDQVARSWSLDEEDAYLLAKIAMAEAEGERVEGKALVMLVVLNRVESDSFPDSISEVIFQKGQFSPVSNGRYDMIEPDQECYDALDMILFDGWDESQSALYFENGSASNWHRNHLQFLFQYGNHYFYTERAEG